MEEVPAFQPVSGDSNCEAVLQSLLNAGHWNNSKGQITPENMGRRPNEATRLV